jgi:Leucine-rich repeat (LRR) protein
MLFLQIGITYFKERRNAKRFIMHDLVHDLARSVMADEYNMEGPNCRYACLTDCSKPLKSSTNSLAKIRALHFADKVSKGSCLNFSIAKHARVLELSIDRVDAQKLFTVSIGELKWLRYLSISCGYLVTINLRCIGMLSKLNYLRISSQNLTVLPESIGEMKGLIHLDLSSCRGLNELPSSFANIRELVYLDLSGCWGVLGIPKALEGLTKLQHLKLSRCHNLRDLPDAIVNLTELRYLDLSGCLNHIFDHSRDQTESFIDRICTLPNMKQLDLSHNSYPLIIPDSARHLNKLVLEGCFQIIKLPECVDNNICTTSESLREFFVCAGDSDTSSNIYLLEHTSPAKLEIWKLENVKSTEEAHNINLSEKKTILELKLLWTMGGKRSVDEMELLTELVPPTTLERFAIEGYCSVGFPVWVMSNTSNHFRNLVRMAMRDLPNCKSIPPLGQLPNLRELTLAEMASLEVWDTSYLSGEDTVNELTKVHIFNCPKLRIRPHLPRAASWFIKKSDNVLVPQPESMSHIGCLTAGDSAVPLHRWGFLHHLLSLRHLRLDGCSDLRISPEISGPSTPSNHLKLCTVAMQNSRNCLGSSRLLRN